MNNSEFTILFAADKGYIPHLGTALYSLLRNNTDINIRVVIFTGGIDSEDRDKLRTIACDFGAALEFFELNDNFFDGLVLNHHFKKSNYYRLFAADLIKSASCLYLDADILVLDSIKELVEIDFSDYYLAAVEDPGFDRHEELGMNAASKYFNSGVMLLNLHKWRRNSVREKVISLIKEKPASIRFVDQCGLNGVVDGRWLELDPKFNCQSSMLTIESHGNSKMGRLPSIVHFTGSGKPWHMNNKHPYKNLYWEYRNETPYRSFFSDDFSFNAVIRYATPKIIKDIIRIFIGRSS